MAFDELLMTVRTSWAANGTANTATTATAPAHVFTIVNILRSLDPQILKSLHCQRGLSWWSSVTRWSSERSTHGSGSESSWLVSLKMRGLITHGSARTAGSYAVASYSIVFPTRRNRSPTRTSVV